MTYDEIVSRLMGETQEYVRKRGYTFGVGADNHVRSGIERAAYSIQGRSDAKLESVLVEYRINLERLVDEMIRQTTIIKDYAEKHPGVIGEETFWAGLSILCPLPPFC